MVWKTAHHCVQFWVVLALVSGQLTEEQKDEILDLHNQYRSVVRPKAADMLHMTWNDDLSSTAQHYAARCIWDYNPDVVGELGENLFFTTRQFNISEAMAKWFDEHQHYEYASQTCNRICRHYTQMVWAKSSRVGCASHFCETLQTQNEKNAVILVCNYSPASVEGEQPYETGEPCSKCPEEMPECIENSCAHIGSTTQESSMYTRTTNTPWMDPVGSAGSTKLSVATLLLSGLMTPFTS